MGTLNTSARNMRSLSSTKCSRASIFETPLRLMSRASDMSDCLIAQGGSYLP